MTITVGRKWDKGAEYIGRGSPLGNPFVIHDASDEDRDRVCDTYDIWLRQRYYLRDEAIVTEIHRLVELAKKGDLTLGCFCAPKRCHGDSVKELIEEIIEEQKFKGVSNGGW